LRDLEIESKSAARSDLEIKSFSTLIKELTITGYYTSEIGATQELKYVPVPGRYAGDIPYDTVGRAYS